MTTYTKTTKYRVLLFFLSVSGLSSCTSHLSNERVTTVSLIHATIEITQNPFDKKDNSIIVVLKDKNGNTVANDSLAIYANGVEAGPTHRQGLYYTNESNYNFTNVPVDKKYKVKIKLSNKKRYVLGEVNALKEEKTENIECRETGDFNKDFVVEWKNLKDINVLSVSTSILLKSKEANEKSYGYKPKKTMRIGGNGSFTIPKSEYIDAKSTISGIEFDFQSTKKGKTNPNLLKNSEITIKTSITKNVNFEE